MREIDFRLHSWRVSTKGMALLQTNAHQLLRGKTVVAADDDIPSLELLRIILTRHGADVIGVVNGSESLEIIKATHPHLVIADLLMPAMSGWDLIREIRHDENLVNTPVVALTAHAIVGVHEQAIRAGFDDYFTKPYHPLELISSISDVLQRLSSTMSENLKMQERYLSHHSQHVSRSRGGTL